MKCLVAFSMAILAVSLCAQSPLDSNASVSLRDARLPAAIKRKLAAVVIAELEDGELNAANRSRIALDSQISFVRLGGRGVPSAILLEPSNEADLCAPNGNGNCPSWLFLRSGKSVVLVLEDHGEGISFAETSHHGMRDLVTTYRIGHTPVTEDVIELHFDGKKYRPVSCSESTTGGDEDDTEIPPHPCRVADQ